MRTPCYQLLRICDWQCLGSFIRKDFVFRNSALIKTIRHRGGMQTSLATGHLCPAAAL
jgi:hypothetical protein